jgi:hypothetical protein
LLKRPTGFRQRAKFAGPEKKFHAKCVKSAHPAGCFPTKRLDFNGNPAWQILCVGNQAEHSNYESDPNVASPGRRFWCRISRC